VEAYQGVDIAGARTPVEEISKVYGLLAWCFSYPDSELYESFYHKEYSKLIKEFPKMDSPEDDSSLRKGVAVAEPRQPGVPMPGHEKEPVQVARKLDDDELLSKLQEEHGMSA